MAVQDLKTIGEKERDIRPGNRICFNPDAGTDVP
jgi:hypothetical protein